MQSSDLNSIKALINSIISKYMKIFYQY